MMDHHYKHAAQLWVVVVATQAGNLFNSSPQKQMIDTHGDKIWLRTAGHMKTLRDSGNGRMMKKPTTEHTV
jgi:hypothetical protein